jgi:hypothetical protein
MGRTSKALTHLPVLGTAIMESRVIFEETLNELHGMLGEAVAVSVVRAEPTFMLAHFRGVLHRGEEIDSSLPIPERPELFFFRVSEHPGDGFFLAESEYTGAGWTTDEQRVLRIEFGAVHLYVAKEY